MSPRPKNKLGRLLGFIAGAISVLFGRVKSSGGRDEENLRHLEFTASTQKMGVRFTEKIRDVFRHKWLKKY